MSSDTEAKPAAKSRNRAVWLIPVLGIAGGLVALNATQSPPKPKEEPRAAADEDTPETPATDATRAALGGISAGSQLGPFRVKEITDPTNGSIRIHTDPEATFEVRLKSEKVLPPITVGPYGIYYRSPKTDQAPTGADLIAGATAIGDLIEKAPKDTAVPAGLTEPTVNRAPTSL